MSQKKLKQCIKCKKIYTKFMLMRIYQHTDEHKCIRCYNLGGSNEHQ